MADLRVILNSHTIDLNKIKSKYKESDLNHQVVNIVVHDFDNLLENQIYRKNVLNLLSSLLLDTEISYQQETNRQRGIQPRNVNNIFSDTKFINNLRLLYETTSSLPA